MIAAEGRPARGASVPPDLAVAIGEGVRDLERRRGPAERRGAHAVKVDPLPRKPAPRRAGLLHAERRERRVATTLHAVLQVELGLAVAQHVEHGH